MIPSFNVEKYAILTPNGEGFTVESWQNRLSGAGVGACAYDSRWEWTSGARGDPSTEYGALLGRIPAVRALLSSLADRGYEVQIPDDLRALLAPAPPASPEPEPAPVAQPEPPPVAPEEIATPARSPEDQERWGRLNRKWRALWTSLSPRPDDEDLRRAIQYSLFGERSMAAISLQRATARLRDHGVLGAFSGKADEGGEIALKAKLDDLAARYDAQKARGVAA